MNLHWKNVICVFFFFGFLLNMSAQEKKITGVVSDSAGPLPGVNVILKGTTIGTETDFDGKYSLKAKTGDILVFSFVGMQVTEKTVGTASELNILMKEDTNVLDEIVVVGYGSTSKKDLTGSVATIGVEQLQDKPVANVTQALQGKTSGLQIVSTGGRAGDATQISIRGNGSLSASNSALYVIDGVPQEDMSGISPEDIKSISILKDAASTAIYGSRASNGVVLIETNRGGYQQGISVSVNTSYGFQNIIKRPELLNATQYKNVLDVARVNYEQDIALGVLNGPKDPTELTPLPSSPYNIDWLKLVLRDNAAVKRHQFSISGGGENTRAYLSASLFDQEGIIKEDNYKVGRIKLNVEQKMNDYVKFGVNSFFSYSESTPIADDNSTYQPYSNALGARPDVNPYGADGKAAIHSFTNPLFAFERQVTDKWQNLGGTLFLDVTPIESVVWRSAFSGNIRNNRYNRYDAPNTRRGLNGDGETIGYGYYSTANNRDYLIENTVTYTDRFANDKLKLTLLGGHSFQQWDYEDSYVAGEKFPSSDLNWLYSAGEINKGRSFIKAMALESYFTRLQLSWDSKYHFMISTRYDGSSKFTKENRWGSFPAASMGWTISNEKFFNVPAITELKVRASFGYTGNQTGISYASGQNLLESGYNYDQAPGLAADEIFNENLKWEKGEAFNIGLDVTLFNKLDVNFDYYEKETQDLLSRINVSQESGFGTMLANVGNISNKGFEVNLNARIIEKDDFRWNFGGNFSYNKNEVLKVGSETGQYETGFVSVVKEGSPLGSFFLLESAGVASEAYTYKKADGTDGHTVAAGDMIYVDRNHDGQISDADRKVFEGGIAPMYGGFNTTVEYKSFDLGISGQYSIGKKVYTAFKERLLNGGSVGAPAYSNNMLTEMLDYWTPTNTNASNPRPHLSSVISDWNMKRSSRFLEDADYLRISDITLGYNFSFLKDSDVKFIKSLRLYAQVRNPFTFTKYSGTDPETNYVDQSAESSQDKTDGSKIQAGVDLGGIPNVKSFLVGLNVKF
ncbi:SusC/RagA family TonB-linked outer membrane protein [Tenacibaculum discolor]|uniref:SusC/RagA family TonB-linked outer membrane protein n=1 Tax=Tenacibaculum discolor TaxID=361581 RepID=UPI000EAFCF7D|nr:TonB-dependent receptor [Tenacibaculum discolor]RLK06793.1 TonB-linked SusC/RagA family outer membrane protein [Tenacibaculum discolor]